ncbi:MAG: HEAT repeat domain-containing protein [Caldilinea sp.]|nr:HEAT repeat domain-containing protein [Caldilinea sp.]MDW8442539.1 HEAT repeat domain-containing protein [Caldilineaceae bacterium]
MNTDNQRPFDFDDDFNKGLNGASFDSDAEDWLEMQGDDESVLDDSFWVNDEGYHVRSLNELMDDSLMMEMPERAPVPSWSPEKLLEQLIVAPEEVSFNEYFALSDLTRAQAETVRQLWPSIDAASRRRIVDLLTRSAEEFLDVDLSVFLLSILDDPDAGIRQMALETLDANEPTPEMLGPIIHRLQHDSVDEVRAAAAAALGHYVLAGELDELDAALAMRAEDALIAILTDPTEPLIVQRRALESIAYSGEVAVRQFIEDAYYSPWEEMRISALTAMGRSADIRWRRMVRAELRNPSPAIRAEAALACGELEAKAALSDLLELLADDERSVRLAAIFALGRLGGKQARRALEELAAGEGEEAQAAEMALEEMLFYAGAEAMAIPLFDEEEEEDFDDLDPWEAWEDDEDEDLGEYE